jgi:hypothetical protein
LLLLPFMFFPLNSVSFTVLFTECPNLPEERFSVYW